MYNPHSAIFVRPIPVSFFCFGRQNDGFLTEVTGMAESWWLHSKGDAQLSGELIDVLHFRNKELFWQNRTKDLVAQENYWRDVLAAWYK